MSNCNCSHDHTLIWILLFFCLGGCHIHDSNKIKLYENKIQHLEQRMKAIDHMDTIYKEEKNAN